MSGARYINEPSASRHITESSSIAWLLSGFLYSSLFCTPIKPPRTAQTAFKIYCRWIQQTLFDEWPNKVNSYKQAVSRMKDQLSCECCRGSVESVFMPYHRLLFMEESGLTLKRINSSRNFPNKSKAGFMLQLWDYSGVCIRSRKNFGMKRISWYSKFHTAGRFSPRGPSMIYFHRRVKDRNKNL